ncbi:TonB-dependent receptor family protein [Lysobacter niastensis]|uniref:TonB-dependent receptor n=1 Tax=Lysobacter niastensis TaxID=380629 RepID=A0ABS0BC53_9GAMM|nr:TonB-dependent receptor [Lysobacter niastensis]MBF6025341.1 TonB-dependent receptor [Lysobacter niastensis]
MTSPTLRRGLAAALVLHAAALPAQQREDATTLDTVQVSGVRQALADFPGAVSVIDGETLRAGQRQVSLAETLVRVPGIGVLDRQNYAQDLQIQSRGFGARSTFGIRGIRLIVDGIPSSALDGQGQAANFPLGSLDRIEVLRGPLALQYGNAAGGAIVAETVLDGPTGVRADGWIGEHGTHRAQAGIEGASSDADWRWQALGSRFVTDGERPHSAAERSQLDAVAQWSPDADRRLRLVAGGLSQPYTDDPLGLTRAQWEREPHGTDPAALLFDTRKKIDNAQAGVRWDDTYAPGRAYWLGGYGIDRDVVQFLAVPVAAQRAPTSAGGVIDLGRRSAGIEAGHRWEFTRGALAVGVEAGRLDEDRRGYENFVGTTPADTVLGVRGRLRRDEDNRIDDREAFVSGGWRFAEQWNALAAVRHARIDFESHDHYIAPGNGDDSGTLDYRETAASLGVSRAFDSGEMFASLGRGFETPTVTELSYRPDGSAGFNDLRAARFDSAEVGARWRRDGLEASVAVYRIDGEDEIVPADNRGGRASFANAGRTRREGIEGGIEGAFGERWSYVATANLLRARFTTPFSYGVVVGGVPVTRTVAAGNRVPGIPRANGYAELAWAAGSGAFDAAVEMRASDDIDTDDRNTEAAPGYAQFALRLQWRVPGSGWHGFVRVDNVFDRDFVGSVIVNEANERYFEPGAGRTLSVGLGWGPR